MRQRLAFSGLVMAGLVWGACTAVATPTQPQFSVWGPETPNFNLEVVLRNDAGGFGLVKFRRLLRHLTGVGAVAAKENAQLAAQFRLPELRAPNLAFVTLARGMLEKAIEHKDLLVQRGLSEGPGEEGAVGESLPRRPAETIVRGRLSGIVVVP